LVFFVGEGCRALGTKKRKAMRKTKRAFAFMPKKTWKKISLKKNVFFLVVLFFVCLESF